MIVLFVLYCAENCVKNLIAADKAVKGAKVAILGFTFKENCPDTRNTKIIDIVHELQEYGKTTKTVARTRLLDFGYTEVKGLLQTANGNLVPSYKSELPADETYTIDEVDGVREYVRNPEFRKIIDTGLYTYVEGHYCLDDSDFIRTDQFGFRHLTPYARVNMDKCCLAFKVVYQNTLIRVFNGIMRKSGGKSRQDFHYKEKDGISFNR